jgi:hypothetical protein
VRRSEGRYSPEDEETRTVNGELAGKHTGEEKRRGEGQMVMDLLNQVYHDVEDEEGYLVVVVMVFDGGTRRFRRKSSLESRRKPNFSKVQR